MVAVRVGLLLLGFASPALSQHESFVEALSAFTSALPGTYGDEAAAARGALDRVEKGLAEWDRTLREYESNVRTGGPTASPARLADMHRALGTFLLTRGRFDDAAREFEAGAGLSRDPRFHLFRGAAYLSARKPAEALKAFAAAWTLDPANPMAAYMLAEASFRAGATPPPAVIATLSDVVDKIADGQYNGERDPFIVTALLPDDLTATPTFIPGPYSASYADLKRSKFEPGVQAMRAAAARDPLLATSGSQTLLQGAQALRAGQIARAIDLFAAAVREAPDSEAHRMLGVAYWLAADDDRGIEHLEQAVRARPMDERARLTLVRVLDEDGETERAARLLEETVQMIPSSATAHSRLGRLYAGAKRTKDAVREYEAAVGVGMFTGEAPLLLAIGELYRRELDPEHAEAAFAKAIALRPNDAAAHSERGRALLQLERPAAAFVELAAALLADAGDYDSYVALGQIHLDAGRYEQAARLLKRAVAIRPDEPEGHVALATALVRAGRPDEAASQREAYARLQAAAFDKQRHNIELSTSRFEASDLAARRQFDRAVAAWTRIVADGPGGADDYAALAAALAEVGQLEKAVAQYDKALSLGAGASAYRQLAALYTRMGRPELAGDTRAKLARIRQAAFGLDSQH